MLSEKRNFFGKQGSSLTLCPLKWVRHALDEVEEVKGFDGRGQVRGVKLQQLMNSAFVGYEELSRSRTVLSTSACNTLLDLKLLNSSYPTKAEFINC